MTELPLFPLSGVLLPGGRMSLQIFEQRYLELVRNCLKSDSPFGVVWIRSGSEVSRPGASRPALGDYGTAARIVDWDQLPNGLLGLTIQGGTRFDLHGTHVQDNGLVVGRVTMRAAPPPAAADARWQPMVEILASLEAHPHVQRLALAVDHGDAWQVGYALIQLLPLDEALKYALLGIDAADALLEQLEAILSRISE